MQTYIKKLIFPVALEILFLASTFVLEEKYFIYTNFLFYAIILAYFIWCGDFNYENLKNTIKGGKKVWSQVILTSVGMIIAFLVVGFLSSVFSNMDDGMFNIAKDNWYNLIIFAVSTIILAPIAEELFFRKAIILFESKSLLIISILIGIILYSLEHSLALLGIMQTMIISIPLTISYIKTRNIYIPILGHFIVNLIGNGATVAIMITKLL